MNRILNLTSLAIIALIFSQKAFAQEFSYTMHFYDAAGNSDSITLGYDPSGTYGIDAGFGEVNCIGTPISSAFDVRITDEWFNRMYFVTEGTYHTKRQIIEENCDSWLSFLGIDIYCENWPVTVVWDNSLFNNPCINGSVFTSQYPGTWWDVDSPSDLMRQELIHDGSVTFTTNVLENSGYSYVNNSGDTISCFWQVFDDSTLLTATVPDEWSKSIVIYPSPTTGVINLDLGNNNSEIENVTVLSLEGKELMKSNGSASLDISNLTDGAYIVLVEFEDGGYVIKKVEKLE